MKLCLNYLPKSYKIAGGVLKETYFNSIAGLLPLKDCILINAIFIKVFEVQTKSRSRTPTHRHVDEIEEISEDESNISDKSHSKTSSEYRQRTPTSEFEKEYSQNESENEQRQQFQQPTNLKQTTSEPIISQPEIIPDQKEIHSNFVEYNTPTIPLNKDIYIPVQTSNSPTNNIKKQNPINCDSPKKSKSPSKSKHSSKKNSAIKSPAKSPEIQVNSPERILKVYKQHPKTIQDKYGDKATCEKIVEGIFKTIANIREANKNGETQKVLDEKILIRMAEIAKDYLIGEKQQKLLKLVLEEYARTQEFKLKKLNWAANTKEKEKYLSEYEKFKKLVNSYKNI